MKIAKIMILWAALLGSSWGAELDTADAGDYVLLNKEPQPMSLKIHLFLVSLAMPSENRIGHKL
ncbi:MULTISPECIES: hypothetical protein [Neisseria]|jgi:hypothetical protein|uniref:hypothetical protein n=1 Tax=Neisseria TaxID=482 RepID=UPI000A72D283|nr:MULTISPECIES: hypothetical protein [Neisseria]